MRSDLNSYMEQTGVFLANRAKFPLEELEKYVGRWIAWSPDGTRIVADAADPRDIDDLVRAAGEDPEDCLVEGIPDTDSVFGGGLSFQWEPS